MVCSQKTQRHLQNEKGTIRKKYSITMFESIGAKCLRSDANISLTSTSEISLNASPKRISRIIYIFLLVEKETSIKKTKDVNYSANPIEINSKDKIYAAFSHCSKYVHFSYCRKEVIYDFKNYKTLVSL